MFHIKNNKPVELEPFVQDTLKNQFDPLKLVQETLVDPLMVPLFPTHGVQLTESGHSITERDVVDGILECCKDTLNPQAENAVKSLYHEALVSYPAKCISNVKSLFAVQAGTAANLPEPNPPMVVYLPNTDIIPICRRFLAGTADYNTLFATFAYYANPTTLGFYFTNEQCFEDFKTFMSQNTATFQNVLPPATVQLCNQFQQTKLNQLTESLLLRNNDTDEVQPFSFARFLVNQLMQYTKQVSSGEFGVFPFDIGELICPKTIVFINIEEHARATGSKVANEWKIINQSLENKTPMVSINQLQKLTATTRNMYNIAKMAATTLSNAQYHQAMRSANVPFRKTPPTQIDISRLILKIMKKMETVNKSMNAYKTLKTTFQKPNRRDPDDFNKKGVTISTQYKPDIHVYLDTSGSITERNYQDAIKALIAMAKKMNVNIYFNSFSHVLSQGVKLHIAGKSVGAIYKEFKKIPKVDGGTDYTLVWNYIERSKQRQRELSILMTDFAYYAPNRHINHPKNLYYIPVSNVDWRSLRHYAEGFVQSIEPNVPGIRRHILM